MARLAWLKTWAKQAHDVVQAYAPASSRGAGVPSTIGGQTAHALSLICVAGPSGEDVPLMVSAEPTTGGFQPMMVDPLLTSQAAQESAGAESLLLGPGNAALSAVRHLGTSVATYILQLLAFIAALSEQSERDRQQAVRDREVLRLVVGGVKELEARIAAQFSHTTTAIAQAIKYSAETAGEVASSTIVKSSSET